MSILYTWKSFGCFLHLIREALQELDLPLTASSWSEEDRKDPKKLYEMTVLLNAQREIADQILDSQWERKWREEKVSDIKSCQCPVLILCTNRLVLFWIFCLQLWETYAYFMSLTWDWLTPGVNMIKLECKTGNCENLRFNHSIYNLKMIIKFDYLCHIDQLNLAIHFMFVNSSFSKMPSTTMSHFFYSMCFILYLLSRKQWTYQYHLQLPVKGNVARESPTLHSEYGKHGPSFANCDAVP